MYDVPAWKQELQRRLEALRERLQKKTRPVTAGRRPNDAVRPAVRERG